MLISDWSSDVCSSDLRVPNGARAAGRLRVLCRRSVPVLIVTADQGQEELQEIAKQGFPALQKPVNPAALRAAIDAQLEGFAVPVPDAAGAPPRRAAEPRARPMSQWPSAHPWMALAQIGSASGRERVGQNM